MQGANIFVVYATENNITVSPRLGVEHVMPLFNPQADSQSSMAVESVMERPQRIYGAIAVSPGLGAMRM